ncbi:MAG: flagellar brake protein [Methylococcaceae bacterium]|nr:flagellar brake protein [Methylococcaceae bacterium]
MEKESDYLVRNPKRITEHLTDIFKKKCIISAQFGENNASFLTAIIALNLNNNTLTLDCAPTELLNKQLLNAEKVLFRTEMDGIKISFSGKDIRKSKDANQAMLEMPIPNTIFWRQRRQFYRVKIPLAHVGSFCEIFFSADRGDGGSDTYSAKFRLTDISLSGFSLLNSDAKFASHFELNKPFTQCTLYLHDATHSSTSVVVKDITNIQANATASQQRIGCFITDVTPAFESSIQRYMQDIERKIKNIAG